jgi:hypothetical protein
MTENLKIEIQNLYDAFSSYPLRRGMEGCPCCVRESDKRLLYSKPLRELSYDELSHYYLKAMTTWGDVNDFKHFVPRFFELLATGTTLLDAFIIFDQLEYGGWDGWSLAEREAVKSFIIAWWESSTLSDWRFDGSDFVHFAKALGGIQPLLDNWKVAVDDDTFRNLINFIFDEYQMFSIGKGINEENYKILKDWVVGQAAVIEQGFYFYEKNDPDFAQKISYCYDIALRQH